MSSPLSYCHTIHKHCRSLLCSQNYWIYGAAASLDALCIKIIFGSYLQWASMYWAQEKRKFRKKAAAWNVTAVECKTFRSSHSYFWRKLRKEQQSLPHLKVHLGFSFMYPHAFIFKIDIFWKGLDTTSPRWVVIIVMSSQFVFPGTVLEFRDKWILIENWSYPFSQLVSNCAVGLFRPM